MNNLMKIAFYNVENLFNTLESPLSFDNEFLPDSKLKWKEKRYILKLQRIAKVIQAIEDPMPLAIGLAEIETRKVLTDLVAALGLSENEVGIIHEESPDERGMDVGFLYRKDIIERTEHFNYPVNFKNDSKDRTRDILYVKAFFKTGEEVHFFINHWPSRKEGAKISMSKRIDTSNILNAQLAYLLGKDPEAKIIVMGDFNCDPESAPVRNILDIERCDTGTLYNHSWQLHKQGEGSLNHKGKWLMFDQILASKALTNNAKGMVIVNNSFRIFKKDWMLFYNPKFRDFRPSKTYGDRKYRGGYSDHLPVYIILELS